MSLKSKTAMRIGITIISATILLTLFSSVVSADSQRWKLGDVTNTGKDNGYSGSKVIDKDDPHYGWSLGQFYVSGYTQHVSESDSSDVFLKNVGDQVELHFELLQDIDELNDNSNLSINADTNGYDQYFSTPQFNDCRGLLIVRKTDYQNIASDPIIYENYLDGVKQGADTVVELCEEGDYEVALDYEIKEDHYGVDWNTKVSVPTYTNYRIFFKFKIRNGNCMVFPFDASTGSELTNESFTENGFYIDLANSRYLEINVQHSVFVEGTSGYSEDVRFNRPASDGTEYTAEGIYTITVSNHYTNQKTTKIIYVGTDPIMRAYVVSGYSLEELKNLISQGYIITEDGTVIPPKTSEETIKNTEKKTEAENDINEPTSTVSTSEGKVHDKENDKEEKKGNGFIPVIVIVSILISGAGVVLFLKRDRIIKPKNTTKSEVPFSQDSNEASPVDDTLVTNETTTITDTNIIPENDGNSNDAESEES